MKLLLTSAGIKNTSIHQALAGLLGKPIAESSALCIPTATYAMGGPGAAWRMITGRAATPSCELGWKSLGVLGYWMRQSGLADLLPSLREAVYVRVSGGSRITAGSITAG